MEADSVITLINLSLEWKTPELVLKTNWWVLIPSIILIVVLRIFAWKWVQDKFSFHDVTMKFDNIEFKVKRNTENLYIANRIYIELVTRKAAQDFEEGKDVIKEVYDSWYDLFKIIREEIKTVPGQYLQRHDATEALIGLTTAILNQGLRPHLTTYQAKFRRWYTEALNDEANRGKSPQEIQREYPEYDALVADMRKVNGLMKAYAEDLKGLIKGEARK